MQRFVFSIAIFIVFILLLPRSFSTVTAQEDLPDHIVRVATTGSNRIDCGGIGNPCRTLQYAVNRAANEEWVNILVAGGVYTRQSGDASSCDNLAIDAVACIINRRVEMHGGYSVTDWTTPNVTENPTIIDGQGKRRGVMMLNVSKPGNTLSMSGFTIRNGFGTGISSRRGNDAISGFGGGMFVDSAGAALHHIRFENNRVGGKNRNSGHGGSAAGGGSAIRGAIGTVTLDEIEFINNRAEGGSGDVRGGYGIGGGLYTYSTIVRADNIYAEGNVAMAGAASGGGVDSAGELSDSQGGALAFHRNSDIQLTNAVISNNKAIGGTAINGNAGGAFGGGIFSEGVVNFTIYDTEISGNEALGGAGINDGAATHGAGYSSGGGMRLSKSPARIERVSVVDNLARGGRGVRYQGSAGGGGISLTSIHNHAATMINVVVAGNRVEMGEGSDASVGGGGGGIWVQGVNVDINHTTIADNELEQDTLLQGTAVALVDRSVSRFSVLLRNSIVARHSSTDNAQAILIQRNGTIQFQNVLVSSISGSGLTGGSGTAQGLDSIRTVETMDFLSPAAPNYDYHISSATPATFVAADSNVSIDRDNRQRDDTPDVGAFEVILFRVSVSPTAVDRLSVRWQGDPVIRSYRLSINCPRGAVSPNEGSCGNSILFSNVTSTELTGLTPYKPYRIVLDGLDTNNQVVVAAESIMALPTDKFAYLPFAAR